MILKQTITAGAGTAEGQPCPMMWCETGRCTCLLTTYSDQHSGPAFYPLCEDCANRLRRAELDRELEEMGATVIRVEDLGAALEAEFLGRCCWQYAGNDPSGFYAPRLDRDLAAHAAHLARLALGVSS